MTEQRNEKGPASYFPSIEKRYGRPVEHWFAVVEASPLERHGELVAMLKAEYGLGHGHANAIVAHVRARKQARKQELGRK